MAKTLFLDKIIKVGTTYKTDEREALIIRLIGTNSTSKMTFKIDRKPCLELIQDVAPAYKTKDTIIGPLELGDYYLVIPPNTEFTIEGASGSYARIIGEKIQLEPQEPLGEPYMSRYHAQFNNYISYVTGALTLETDEAFPAGEEKEIYSLKPSSIERYVFNDFASISYSGGTVNPGDFALVFYLDNNPFEFIQGENEPLGIDILHLPAYNKADANEYPFSFKVMPIEITGPHLLSLRIINISGADKAPASGSAWSFTFYAVVKYHRME